MDDIADGDEPAERRLTRLSATRVAFGAAPSALGTGRPDSEELVPSTLGAARPDSEEPVPSTLGAAPYDSDDLVPFVLDTAPGSEAPTPFTPGMAPPTPGTRCWSRCTTPPAATLSRSPRSRN
ncbi:hypothetical protein ACFQX6_55450 [Streptosporangium lutulentum]